MLKEEDPLIELIREWIMAPIDESAGLQLSTLEVFALVEDMINEHVASPQGSRLKKYIPKVKRMFMRINLMDAVHAYDAVTHFSRRKRVPPTFKDVRHILNLATIRAIAPTLKLVTFDADDTIYADGGSISESSDMVTVIVELLKKGLVVSLVTAAGYPGEPQRYEARLRGILDALAKLPDECQARFLVMGGECNYLHVTSRDVETGVVSLRVVDPAEWKDGRGQRWDQFEVDQLLDLAQSTLEEMVALLDMPAKILRKERAVGIYNPTDKRFVYENLEEIALTVQHVLRHSTIPHCAFNGGNDVWVDIGNKALGISALQHYVVRLVAGSKELEGFECLHVGDRFTRTGNDTLSRDVASTVWVSNPEETAVLVKMLLPLL
ncbi:hypothetical protein H310_14156 [Aphanomyces invadans]|uniref:IMP-specific 5'-nucleotidase 1 n=1 Tax=Aphanomyces invadans TaxID=157072 RepID=A0A024TAV3_9STRA|nr:hypothetical protein H310_14156 [Aphanomyces invadans]ETV91144.1 hypothetical protein H310_14156 [Aphanomyces invadans]|eukprot:XP_008880175.1 hypothetical protein H310_14156 [Aphanomyces invadans]